MLSIACVGGLGKLGSEIVKIATQNDEVNVSYIVESPLCELIGESVSGAKVVASILEAKDADMFIDTTSAAAVAKNISMYEEAGKPVIIATTKLEEVEDRLDDLSKKVPLLVSSNFDVRLMDFLTILKLASKLLGEEYGVRVLEIHHDKKTDSPSGTAKTIVQTMKDSLKIQAIPPTDFYMAGKTSFDNEFESVRFTVSGKKDDRITHIIDVAKEIYKEMDMDFKTSYWYGGDEIKGTKEIKPYLGTQITSIRTGNIVGIHSVCFVNERSALRITHDVKTRSVFAKGAIEAAIRFAGKEPGRYEIREIFGRMKLEDL